MKALINKAVSLTMAVMLLFATTSFTANMHFCCNKLIDIAVLSKSKVCDYESGTPAKSKKECSFAQKDCCNDVSFTKSGDIDLKKKLSEFETEKFTFLKTFLYTYINLFEGLENNMVPFEEYVPPLILKDILVLHETFLI